MSFTLGMGYMRNTMVLHIAILVSLGLGAEVSADSRAPSGILKRRYIHRCPPGTEQVGGGPPQSSMVFCREALPRGYRLQGDFTSFYKNGNKKIEGAYTEGKKTGEWKNFKNNGELLSTITYENGRIIKRDNTLKLKKAPPKIVEKKEYYEDKEVFQKFNQTRAKGQVKENKNIVYGIGAK